MTNNSKQNQTFSSFVVDGGNELVFAATQTIVREPLTYNPFFMYGKQGSGKTHLLHAIGNAITKETNGKSKILYVTGEQFHTDFLNTKREGQFSDFIKLYQSYDVVMIDNIEARISEWMMDTQKSITEVIDGLVNNKRQVIITSELQPERLPFIDKHFRSTYEGGMMANIFPVKEIVSSGVE